MSPKVMDGVKGFNLPIDDMDRAVSFYRKVFGWRIEHVSGSSGGFHGAETTPTDERGDPITPGAINGGLFRRGTHGIDSPFFEVHVESVDAAIEMALASGGSVVTPKRKLLDLAFFAIIRDTEGNALGLWEDL